MNPATLRAPRNSKSPTRPTRPFDDPVITRRVALDLRVPAELAKKLPSFSAPVTAAPRRDAQKQVLLCGASDDLPRRWERIVQQGGRA